MHDDQVGFLPGMQGYLSENTKNATGPIKNNSHNIIYNGLNI